MGVKHGTIWWSELNTHDPDKARTFFCNVMGCTAAVVAMNDLGRAANPGEASYTTLMDGEMPVCGIFDLRTLEGMENIPSHWLTYFAVDDADATCKKIKAEGGCVMREPFDVPGVGRIAIVQDPTGGVFGLGTPAVGEC